MADIKISELNAAASLNNGDLVEVSQVDEFAPSGYSSKKATMTELGDKVNTDIEYTTDLADFTDKTITGAIKENKVAIGTNATAIGDLSTLTTSVQSSLVGAVNEVNEKAESFIYSTVTDFITFYSSIPDNTTVGFSINKSSVSNCPASYPIGVIVKRNDTTGFIILTQINGTDSSYIGRIIQGNWHWRKITTTA